MRNRATTKRSVHPAVVILLGLVVLVVGGLGTIGILAYAGVVDLTRFFRGQMQNPYAGKISVPASGTQIPAYAAVTREHLFEANTQTVKLLYIRPEEIQPGWILDLSKILGRVMSRDKPAGRVFVEADFLPAGTRSGLVAGIPAGKLALAIDGDQVQGLKELRQGDRFDLVATQSLDLKGMQPQVRWKTTGKSSIANVGTGSYTNQKTKVTVLVHNGSVVSHAASKAASNAAQTVPGANRLTGNDPGVSTKGNRDKDAKLITIALDPSEVGSLTEALTAKETLFCLAHSGSPSDKGDATIPEKDPMENVSVIETMRGRNFSMEAFSTEGEELQKNAADKPAVQNTSFSQPAKSVASPPAVNSSSKSTGVRGG